MEILLKEAMEKASAKQKYEKREKARAIKKNWMMTRRRC